MGLIQMKINLRCLPMNIVVLRGWPTRCLIICSMRYKSNTSRTCTICLMIYPCLINLWRCPILATWAQALSEAVERLQAEVTLCNIPILTASLALSLTLPVVRGTCPLHKVWWPRARGNWALNSWPLKVDPAPLPKRYRIRPRNKFTKIKLLELMMMTIRSTKGHLATHVSNSRASKMLLRRITRSRWETSRKIILINRGMSSRVVPMTTSSTSKNWVFRSHHRLLTRNQSL